MLNQLAVCTFNHYDQLFGKMGQLVGLRFASALASSSSSSSVKNPVFDVVIIGGGIVGTATARQLAFNKPNLKMAILEKESELGQHQTGHNSGVIHAGIYYKPGSLKAKLCVDGSKMAYQYFDSKKIPYRKCGKLIVACDQTEIERLEELYQRSLANGVDGVKLLQTEEEIQKYEPNCRGLKAIWSENTGIVDWGLVNRSYGDDFHKSGGDILNNFKVTKFVNVLNNDGGDNKPDDSANTDYPIVITGEDGRQVRSRFVITAAGLHADKVAQLTNGKMIPKIVPFRGEYLVLKKESSNIVKTNIYPVPDPRFPFLGVHFTPRMDGSIWVGPNAVLAFKREGYSYRDLSLSELYDTLSFRGFQKLAFRYLSAGINEFYRSLSVRAQLKQLQRFVPSITIDDIDLGQIRAGVRAQALDLDGSLVDDFVFEVDENSGRILHVRNAPSPAATSSMAIATIIATKAEQQFKL